MFSCLMFEEKMVNNEKILFVKSPKSKKTQEKKNIGKRKLIMWTEKDEC